MLVGQDAVQSQLASHIERGTQIDCRKQLSLIAYQEHGVPFLFRPLKDVIEHIVHDEPAQQFHVVNTERPADL